MEVERSIPPDNRILFFARDRPTFGFLSHFHPSPIILDGLRWDTVEHYYQAQRSFDPDYRDAVRSAPYAALAKRLAVHPDLPRRVAQGSWFRKNKKLPRPDWAEVKLDIMRQADWAKFSQNADLAQLMLATGSAELIEDSPFDPYWGVGPDGTGFNWAGRVLMEVRDRLRRGIWEMCERPGGRGNIVGASGSGHWSVPTKRLPMRPVGGYIEAVAVRWRSSLVRSAHARA